MGYRKRRVGTLGGVNILMSVSPIPTRRVLVQLCANASALSLRFLLRSESSTFYRSAERQTFCFSVTKGSQQAPLEVTAGTTMR